MKWYFIVNPNAGRGKGLRVWNEAKKILNKRHESYEVYFTAAVGDARKKARELTADCTEERRIITVGGDGTMNEVLDGVSLHCPLLLGHIPSGSGNDFGRSMHLSGNVRHMLTKMLACERADCIDYGVLSCAEAGCIRRFMVSSGIGFDAAVCHQLLDSRTKDAKCGRGRGKAAYIIAGLRELIFAKPMRGYLILDGARRVEFNSILFVSCHIHPFEGGGFCFAPGADPRDGKLKVCVLSGRNKLRLIPTLLRARGKAMRCAGGVHFFECEEVQIHTEQPLAVHVDGESCRKQKDLDIRCVAGQLRFLH